MSCATTLPDDVDALKALLRQRDEQLADRDAQIETLRGQIKALLDHRFGRSSEQLGEFDASQFGLFDEAEVHAREQEPDESGGIEVAGHKRRPRRAPLPAHLPRVDVEHDLPEAQRICPHDGTALRRIGEDASEQLDIIPQQVRVIRHLRAKYACPCCDRHIVTAPRPSQLIPKSLASEGTLAFVVTSKFVDGLPLNRISAVLARIGVDVPRHTLAGWMIATGQAIEPLIARLNATLIGTGLIQMDETHVQVLREPGKTAESKSYMWARTGGDEIGRPIRLFDYAPSRSGSEPTKLLEGFRGYLHTDGYSGYDQPVREHQLTPVYCWAHARRFYVKALKQIGITPNKIPAKPPPKAKRLLKALRFIQQLYGVEARVRSQSPEERRRLRQQDAIPILDAFRQWCEQTQPKVTPSSGLGQALAYTLNHWDGLVRYVEDGRLEIDTNRTENSIRPFVLGRKAWLFSASVAGAKASANLYSLIETAKANGHEPYAYLRAVFAALPIATADDQIEALLPWNLSTA